MSWRASYKKFGRFWLQYVFINSNNCHKIVCQHLLEVTNLSRFYNELVYFINFYFHYKLDLLSNNYKDCSTLKLRQMYLKNVHLLRCKINGWILTYVFSNSFCNFTDLIFSRSHLNNIHRTRYWKEIFLH